MVTWYYKDMSSNSDFGLQTKVGIKMGTLPGVVCPTDLVEIIKCPD
jgi:hypothetical protein